MLCFISSRLMFAQMDAPPGGNNPRAFVSEEVGITSIDIKYARPHVNGREGKIWGGLVGNGFSNMNLLTNKLSSPWRAGANEATIISFEHDVKVEGKELKAGTYALFMAMEKDNVTLVFSKQKDAWGSFYYKAEDDVLRINVKPVVLDKSVEWLKYEFIEHNEKYCVVAMQWEKLSIPFKVEVDVENIVITRFREEVIGPKGFLSANLIHASQYCFNKNINLEEALVWAQKAIVGPFGQTGYMALRNLATGYEKLNRLPQADSVMNEALAMAKISEYITYEKILIAQKRTDRALDIMEMAKTKFGDVFAVNNGFVFAYSAKGDYAKAIEYATKALTQTTNKQTQAGLSEKIEQLKKGKDIN